MTVYRRMTKDGVELSREQVSKDSAVPDPNVFSLVSFPLNTYLRSAESVRDEQPYM